MAIPTTITDMSATASSNSPSGSETIGTSLDDYLRAYQAVIRAEYDKTVPAINPGGRLTLETGVAVSTSDQTAKTTLYYTPYVSDKVVLFDGTNWKQYTFTERSIAVPATTDTMYDVFLYDNAGTLTLELTAWTNDTTRATALTTQNGVLVKTGATTRRYLGSFRTTGVSGQTEDSVTKRYVWNYYNRVSRSMQRTDSTDTWTYTTNTWRQANGSADNQLDAVIGVAEDVVNVEVRALASNTSSVELSVGVGLNSTSSNSAQTFGAICAAGANTPVHAKYSGVPGIGRRYFPWLEISEATGTSTWRGDNGSARIQSGMVGDVFG